MEKIVCNSTEGGAHIKGTIRLSLKEYIEKYCKKTIDKSKVKPLLTYADDADKLIEKVIPLLQQDIDNLDEIITNSRKGMAICHGIKILVKRRGYDKLFNKKKEKLFDRLNKEAVREARGNKLLINQLFFKKTIEVLPKSPLKNIMVMSDKNFLFSESAHIAALKNPLVNVAIYGASRRIQSRDIKGESSINAFLKSKPNALARTERNVLILNSALTAAESLKKGYKKTLRILKKYNETKNNKILVSSKGELINLKDAEDYFETGNWAHPLLDAEKILDKKFFGIVEELDKEGEGAMEVLNKALKMKSKAIEKAKEDEKEYHDKMTQLVRYNELIEEAKEAGGVEKDFDKALKLMKMAIELMPDEQEARWGLATALHHVGYLEKSIKEYENLIEKFPDNNKFQFEYGQVLLRNNQMQEGMRAIGKVMEQTDEFDYFLSRIGDIYAEGKMFEEAIIAYDSYLEKFPYDFVIWTKKGDCLTAIDQKEKAKKAYKKALEIKPNLKIN